MGWNCAACGYLLTRTPKPGEEHYLTSAAWSEQYNEHMCQKCKSRWYIKQGKQPHLYSGCVIVGDDSNK